MILLNGEKVVITSFPDKTSQVWNISETKKPIDGIKFWFHTEDEILHLIQLCNLLKSQNRRYVLHMPYLPYGRQDKEIGNSSTFALHSFASVINMLNCEVVTTLDAHSSIARTLINNFHSIYPSKEINNALKHSNADCIAFPDAGASLRYENPLGMDPILGEKERDQATGRIIKYLIKGDPAGKKILIVDDICDGGMTFKLMAEELLKYKAKEVHLYTTHGIYSKGIKTLKDSGIKRIFDKIGESI